MHRLGCNKQTGRKGTYFLQGSFFQKDQLNSTSSLVPVILFFLFLSLQIRVIYQTLKIFAMQALCMRKYKVILSPLFFPEMTKTIYMVFSFLFLKRGTRVEGLLLVMKAMNNFVYMCGPYIAQGRWQFIPLSRQMYCFSK